VLLSSVAYSPKGHFTKIQYFFNKSQLFSKNNLPSFHLFPISYHTKQSAGKRELSTSHIKDFFQEQAHIEKSSSHD
jgi:hypothetical protein